MIPDTPPVPDPSDQIAFRRTVVIGLNALTQNFLAVREGFIREAASEAGLDPGEWIPNFELGVFISKKPPI